jgi:photosystem II stability/assembly factor-like uncharacterized protein
MKRLVAALMATLPSMLATPLSPAASAAASGYSLDVIRGRCHGCQGADLGHLQMLTQQEGWAVGFFFPKGEGGGDSTVLHTVDGGKHWMHLPVWEHGAFEPAMLFSFGDRLHGLMWWMDQWAEPRSSRTVDGGRTWQDRPTDDVGRLIKFFGPRRGLALGRTLDGEALLVTEDGGETWAARRLPDHVRWVACSAFIDPSLGYMAGYGLDHQLAIVSTADGGTTWSKGSVPTSTDGWVVDCTRSNAASAWLVSWRSNDAGSEVLRSSDAGRTWARVLDPTMNGRGYYVSTVRFLTDDLGFAFARPIREKGSDLLVTRDAGAHWSRERRLSQSVTECAPFEGALWCTAGLDIVKVSPASAGGL